MDAAGIADIESDATTVDETPADTEMESEYDFSVNEASDAMVGALIGAASVTEKSSDGAFTLGSTVMPDGALLTCSAVVSNCPTEDFRMVGFPSDAAVAGPMLSLCDTGRRPDDDGIEDIETGATLATSFVAGCDNAAPGSATDAVNEPFAGMLVCALFSLSELVASKCPVEVLRADDFLSGTTGAEPSLSL